MSGRTKRRREMERERESTIYSKRFRKIERERGIESQG